MKTSLAPGSRVVTAYLKKSGLLRISINSDFTSSAYGCTTCIGNSGPLDPAIENAIEDNDLVAAAVLSGNRNFEGRVHPQTKANYLMSPPLVVAYALAGHDGHRPHEGTDRATRRDGKPVYLKDIWPAEEEIREIMEMANDPETSTASLYKDIATSNAALEQAPRRGQPVYEWNKKSTYIQEPPFVLKMAQRTRQAGRREQAPACWGTSVTSSRRTIFHLPAPFRKTARPGQYLIAQGVTEDDFNSYGARRGNHEVMIRGTFANIRIRNKMVGKEGGLTVHVPIEQRDVHLRRFDAIPEGRHAPRRHRRQNVRRRLLARLGRERDVSARRESRDRARASSASTAATSSRWACSRWSL